MEIRETWSSCPHVPGRQMLPGASWCLHAEGGSGGRGESGPRAQAPPPFLPVSCTIPAGHACPCSIWLWSACQSAHLQESGTPGQRPGPATEDKSLNIPVLCFTVYKLEVTIEAKECVGFGEDAVRSQCRVHSLLFLYPSLLPTISLYRHY